MSKSFNLIVIVGYLGRDVETRQTANGVMVATWKMATDDQRKEEEERVTTWFRVTAFGRMAEIAQQYLHKGSHCYVSGTISQETYQDRDGQQRISLEVRARDLKLLDPAPRGVDGHRTGRPVAEDVPF